jgi:uncharacterized protein (DUF433 family)
MNWDRITIDPTVCLGKPRVRGTRITVEFVLKLMASGCIPDQIANEYPELVPEDVRQCAAYGAWLASERLMPDIDLQPIHTNS